MKTTGEKYYQAEPSTDCIEKAVREAAHITVEKPKKEAQCVAFGETVKGPTTIDRIGTVYASVLSGHKVYLNFLDGSFLSLEKDGGEDIITAWGTFDTPLLQ